jgi:hypothetical protein
VQYERGEEDEAEGNDEERAGEAGHGEAPRLGTFGDIPA